MVAACAQTLLFVLCLGGVFALPLAVAGRRQRRMLVRFLVAPLLGSVAVLAGASLLSFVVVRAAETLHASDEYVGLLLAGSTWPALAAFLLGRWLTRRRLVPSPPRARPPPRTARGADRMNAESTVFRASRPAVVVAPGGEGARPPPGCSPGRCGWPRRRSAAGCSPPPPWPSCWSSASGGCTTPPTSPAWPPPSARRAAGPPAGRLAPGPAPPAVRWRRRSGPSGRRPGRGRRRLVGRPPEGGRRQGPGPAAAPRQRHRDRGAGGRRGRVADAQRLRDRPQGLLRLEGVVRRTVGTKAGAVLVALLTLALLSSRASPGFPLAEVPRPSAGRSPRRSGPSPSGRPAPSRPASEGPAPSPCPTSPAATSASTPTRPRPARA